MKVITSFRPTLQSLTGQEYSGRTGRRALGDIKTQIGSAAPVKSFQASLSSSKLAPAQPAAAQTGTTSIASSNASILSAIGVRGAAPRQNSVTPGIGRSPSNPPRSPITPTQTIAELEQSVPVKFNSMQQNWLDANTGSYANLMVNNLNRSTPFAIDGVDIRWSNGSTGKPEFSTRAVGNVSIESGRQLAELMGGSLIHSPFETFGTTQRDQYIRMPNGHMVEASVLASQLNAAREASDPFSATQSVLEIYRLENETFDLNTSNNAIDLVSKRSLTANWPLNRPT